MENKIPDLYLSQSKNQNGITMYRVIYKSSPLIADTSNEEIARKNLIENAKKLGISEPTIFWNGDLGTFVNSEKK